MARLIDANELKISIENAPATSQDGSISLDEIEDFIKDAPTVDAVEVVRRKDCKYYGGEVFGNRCKKWSSSYAGLTHFTRKNDFCSYGERKET